MSDTRLYILKTAFRLFMLKNFKEVTMQEIVKETGLSKGAFYHYFESKEQLFQEVVSMFYLADNLTSYDDIDQSSMQALYRSYLIHLQKFIDFVRQTVDVEEEAYNNLNYFTLVFDALNRFPDFRERTRATQQEEYHIWASVARAAQEKGEIRTEMPPEQVARLFLYSVDANFIHAIMEGQFSSALQQIEELWDSLYRLLRR